MSQTDLWSPDIECSAISFKYSHLLDSFSFFNYKESIKSESACLSLLELAHSYLLLLLDDRLTRTSLLTVLGNDFFTNVIGSLPLGPD